MLDDTVIQESRDIIDASNFVLSRACNTARADLECYHSACHEERRIAARLREIAFRPFMTS